MNITIRQIEYFISVAKYQSFSKASEASYVSQPALSQQILLLEDALNTKLIDRSTRKVKLTEAGEVYLKYITRAMKALSEGKRAIFDVSSLNAGDIKIAAIPPLIYPVSNLIRIFIEKYPNVSFSITELSQDQIYVSLHEEKIDLGFGFNGLSSSFIKNFNVEKIAIGKQKICFFISNDLVDQKNKKINADEIYPLVLLTGDFALRRYIDGYLLANNKNCIPLIETNSIAAILTLVGSGKFSSYLPEKIIRMNNHFHIACDSLDLPECEVVILRNRSSYKSKASDAFVQLSLEICSIDNF